MKVLIVSPVDPCPSDSGSKIRIYHSAERLTRRYDCDGLCLSDNDKREPSAQAVHSRNDVCRAFQAVGKYRGRSESVLRSISDATTYRAAKFYRPCFRARLRRLVVERDYDLVWVHFLNMMQYFRDSVIEKTLQNVPVVLDQHNDDERVWRRMQDRGSLIERLYARWNIPRIREFRSWAVSRCDLVLSVSD